MSTAIQGKRIIYKYRVYEDATTEAAWTLAFKTEDETKIKADADATKTKDGTMRTPSDPEIEISSTSIMAKEDTKADKLNKTERTARLAALPDELPQFEDLHVTVFSSVTGEGVEELRSLIEDVTVADGEA